MFRAEHFLTDPPAVAGFALKFLEVVFVRGEKELDVEGICRVLENLRIAGVKCGEEIAVLLKKRHPDAHVYPLYRSAVAFSYDREKRVVRIFFAGDPTAWGKPFNEENLEEVEFKVAGGRFAPEFYALSSGKPRLMLPLSEDELEAIIDG